MSMDSINLNVGILKEALEDLPDEYMVLIDTVKNGVYLPVYTYTVDDESKELILKTH